MVHRIRVSSGLVGTVAGGVAAFLHNHVNGPQHPVASHCSGYERGHVDPLTITRKWHIYARLSRETLSWRLTSICADSVPLGRCYRVMRLCNGRDASPTNFVTTVCSVFRQPTVLKYLIGDNAADLLRLPPAAQRYTELSEQWRKWLQDSGLARGFFSVINPAADSHDNRGISAKDCHARKVTF